VENNHEWDARLTRYIMYRRRVGGPKRRVCAVACMVLRGAVVVTLIAVPCSDDVPSSGSRFEAEFKVATNDIQIGTRVRQTVQTSELVSIAYTVSNFMMHSAASVNSCCPPSTSTHFILVHIAFLCIGTSAVINPLHPR
jgi:hypothetical protein